MLALSEVTLKNSQAGGGFVILDQPMAKEFWGLGVRKDEPALYQRPSELTLGDSQSA